MPIRVVIDDRYRGFEGVAQGGYTSGLLAGSIEGPARVRLRGPVPMGCPLRLEDDGESVTLFENGDLLAEATPATLGAFDLPEPVSAEEAEAASSSYPGYHAHPFPGCFCCGPARERGDGLRVFPGRLPARDEVAAPWIPDASVADEQGLVRPEVVWAAFDCPQLWSLMLNTAPDSADRVVTGALESELRGPVEAGGRYVIVAWPSGSEGRRLLADAVLFSEAGEALAVSRQTAVVTEFGVPLGLSAFGA